MKYRMKLGKDTGTRYLVISSNGVVLIIFVGISSIFEDGGKERVHSQADPYMDRCGCYVVRSSHEQFFG